MLADCAVHADLLAGAFQLLARLAEHTLEREGLARLRVNAGVHCGESTLPEDPLVAGASVNEECAAVEVLDAVSRRRAASAAPRAADSAAEGQQAFHDSGKLSRRGVLWGELERGKGL